MNRNAIKKMRHFLFLPFEPRRTKSRFINRDVCVFIGIAFCLFTFYLSCERDFSSVGEKKIPPVFNADTTSHNFVWTFDTIGTTNSYLSDVEIIDMDDIWAVGQIYPDDSTLHPYGAVHWNGQQWEAKRLLAQTPAGYTSYLRPTGIIAFSKYEIWLASGGVHKYDGQHIQSYWINNFPGNPDPLLDEGQYITKLWGTSSSDLYAVGPKGAVAHYDGSNWQKLESGTTVDIQDIWGAMNPQSGEYEILALASFGPFPPQAKQLLSIQGTTVTAIPDSGLALSLAGIWFVPGKIYYVVGDGVFYTEEIGQFWHSDTTHPLLYKVGVRGNAANDVFVTGSFGLVSHYNGSTWHHYSGAELPIISGGYGMVSFKSNCVVAVGRIGDQAIILRGIKN